jgi:hypothetical protein
VFVESDMHLEFGIVVSFSCLCYLFVSFSQPSGISMMTPEPSRELEKLEITGHHVRGSTEYVRLAISDEPRVVEAEMLQPQAESRITSFKWWMKVSIWGFVIVILSLLLVKWGVPFAFEKVLPLTS